jgi:hypothetical protein
VRLREDRHDAADDLLRLVTSAEELLLDLGTGPDGQPVGLSAVHVVPVLAFTSFSGARRAETRLGRIRLTAVSQLPALLAAQSTVLSAGETDRVADHLDEQMLLGTATQPATSAFVRFRALRCTGRRCA